MPDPMERVAAALERMADRQDRFYTEALNVLTQAKEPDVSLRSGQPAAASGCRVCGNPDVDPSEQICLSGPLTRPQWLAHHSEEYFESRRLDEDKFGAVDHADRWTANRFGPCPEDSP